MCDFNVLYYDDWGYTAHCGGCNRMQVAFGTVVFSFSGHEFREFSSVIRAQSEKCASCADCPVKNMHIRTADENMLLAFSPQEIHRLNDMLQQAFLLREAKQILQ
ncbi:MAG: hypothetical protein FD123_2113 [Bacteroidetes bacterium]|nr:MAG: hypothetical protein FD123_2113 [Bacteroidota bacterium]